MAFKKTINAPIGVQVQDAYHRVEFVMIDKSKKRIEFRLRTYKDVNSSSWISDASHACRYDINGLNPIAQAYVYLKSQSEFQDAQDC